MPVQVILYFAQLNEAEGGFQEVDIFGTLAGLNFVEQKLQALLLCRSIEDTNLEESHVLKVIVASVQEVIASFDLMKIKVRRAACKRMLSILKKQLEKRFQGIWCWMTSPRLGSIKVCWCLG